MEHKMKSGYDKYRVDAVDKIAYFNASVLSIVSNIESNDTPRALEIITDLLVTLKDCTNNEYVENIKNILSSVFVILSKGNSDNIRIINIMKSVIIER